VSTTEVAGKDKPLGGKVCREAVASANQSNEKHLSKEVTTNKNRSLKSQHQDS